MVHRLTKYSHWLALVLAGAVLMASPLAVVNAATLVDFTDSTWSGADGSNPFTAGTLYDGVTVTASAGPVGATLYQDSIDGLGVRYSYEYDEIESDEILTISFDQTVRLTSIGISDLFIETGIYGNYDLFAEQGSYWINGDMGTAEDFFGIQSTGTNGELLIAGLNLVIDSISFMSLGEILGLNQNGTYGWQGHEFSLQSLEIAAVPIPAAIWLFATALGGFLTYSRKVKA